MVMQCTPHNTAVGAFSSMFLVPGCKIGRMYGVWYIIHG